MVCEGMAKESARIGRLEEELRDLVGDSGDEDSDG